MRSVQSSKVNALKLIFFHANVHIFIFGEYIAASDIACFVVVPVETPFDIIKTLMVYDLINSVKRQQ
jgi:hypothetical protein